MGLAMYFRSTPNRITALVKSGRLESIDADITAYGYLPENPGIVDFNALIFGQKQEVESFLEAKAGDEFNLSSEEYQSFSAIVSNDEELPDTAARQYRVFLLQRLQRLQAYKRHALKGVAAYAI
ncbi:hypothetical protein [Methylomonas sp. MgM2]